jgi:hypothetical protein
MSHNGRRLCDGRGSLMLGRGTKLLIRTMFLRANTPPVAKPLSYLSFIFFIRIHILTPIVRTELSASLRDYAFHKHLH